MQLKKQWLAFDMEQLMGSKLGKAHNKAEYCHPYMQNASCEMLSWMNHKLESRLLGEISTTSDMQMIHNGRKLRGTKKPLEGERGE